MSAAASALLSVCFAAILAVIAQADSLWFGNDLISADGTARVTVRVPQFAGFRDNPSGTALSHGSIVVARGEAVSPQTARIVATIASERPDGWPGLLAHAAGLLALALIYTGSLRRTHRGRLLRTQLVNLIWITIAAAIVKAVLLATPFSVLAVPIGAIALPLSMISGDRMLTTATGLFAALVIALLVPFDSGTALVLGFAGLAPILVVGRAPTLSRVALGCIAGAVSGAVVYPLIYLAAFRELPTAELAEPLSSSWLAAVAGGFVGSLAAVVVTPVYSRLLGEMTRGRLAPYEDLAHPLLKRIAEKSPGTWQHSLAVANMAALASTAVGANGRLARVGAYFHDLGKSLAPAYFIENQKPGETSPHESMEPHNSCDAIFGHVVGGVELARKEGLPERIVDFMHMHHGDGLLEYFWAKCQESGNPRGLTEDDFRYPGVPPQSKETAILAICDAVEAASRTLRQPDEHAIRNLVQRIVYGKLHLGQFDEAGLTAADLRIITDSLVDTIKHAHHSRIEYPWQRRESEDSAAAAAAPGEAVASATGLLVEPRLDSLDAPRPYWRSRKKAEARAATGTEPTDQLPEPGTVDIGGKRKPAERPQSSIADPIATTDLHADALRSLEDQEDASPAERSAEYTVEPVVAPDPNEEVFVLDDDHIPTLPPGKVKAPAFDEGDPEGERTVPEQRRRTTPAARPAEPAPTEDSPVTAEEQTPAPAPRAPSEDGLSPGVLVIGAPPATRPPTRTFPGMPAGVPELEDPTVERQLPVPREATPPDRRKTLQHSVVVPDGARRDDE